MKSKNIVNFSYSGILLAATTPPEGVNNSWFRDVIGSKFTGATGSLSQTITVGGMISVVIQILLIVAAGTATVFLMVGGYRYVVSSGNEEQAEAAKKTMTSAAIGLAVIVLAFVIIRLLISVLLSNPTQIVN